MHYEFSMGIGTYNLNHESPCYITCIECTHMPFQFLAEVVAEFYDFSAFSPFLTFDHVFSCITMTIEIENTPFLLHLTKMFSKTNTWQQVINLCQSWEIRLEMK